MAFENPIQNVVYSLGEGRGRAVLHGFIAAALLLIVGGIYAGRQFSGLREARSLELAQLARYVAAGQGMTTDHVRPADLDFLERAGRPGTPGDGIPDLRHAPLYPYVLGTVLRLARIPDRTPPGAVDAAELRAVLPLGFACSLLCGLLIMAVGARLFGARVGTTAFAVFAVSEVGMQAAVSGSETPLAMLLTTTTLALALAAGGLRARHAHPAAWLSAVVGAGVAGGLAALTDYSLIVAVVIAAGLLASGFVRWRGAMVVLMLLVAAGVMAPWIVRNVHVSGKPFGIAPAAALHANAAAGDQAWDRGEPAPTDSRDILHAVEMKFVRQAGTLCRSDLPTLGGGVIMALFIVSLLRRFEQDQSGPLAWWLVAGLVLQIIVLALGNPGARALLPYWPLVVVVGVAALYNLLDDLPFLTADLRQAVVVAVVALSALPLVFSLIGPAAPSPYPPYAPPLVRFASGLMAPGELLATDIPEAVAWYGRTPALLIPMTTDELVSRQRGGLPIGGVYLTTATGDQPYLSELLQGRARSWLPLLNHLVPEAFPWQHGIALPPETSDQIVLTDASPWGGTNAAATPPSSASGGGSASAE